MTIDQSRRRALPLAFLAAAAVAGATEATAAAKSNPAPNPAPRPVVPPATGGLVPSSRANQSRELQAVIDQAASRGATVTLQPGTYLVGDIVLRPGTRITGAGATLQFAGAQALFSAADCKGICLDGVVMDGANLPTAEALISLVGCDDLRIENVAIRRADKTALRLERASGRVTGCSIVDTGATAILSLDAAGLEISHNVVERAGDNGILVWRSSHGEDATRVVFNRIAGIANVSGGSGQYGNGINVYRAGGVAIANNRIADCAYSAVRANEASNVQITANSAERIGEVAIYAEAADERPGAVGFEGAVISANIVDGAASGIVVTNFSNGGRLAVVQGNLVRNLLRREHEPVDKRGDGIAVEADAVVSNNVVEGAPNVGISIGWGPHMRDVVATGNLIRRSGIGIGVSSTERAGQCLIAQNMISGCRNGAIRAMNHGVPVGDDVIAGKAPRHVQAHGNVAT